MTKLIIFADGTSNSSSSSTKTNVWRLFEALDLDDPGQFALYTDGVGTSSNTYLAAIGGATGWGVKKNVLTLYKFLCRNYPFKDQDEFEIPEIYAFGFSRGAFTIRVLVGLIAHAGLVHYETEEDLDHHAAAAYRSYRTASFTSCSPITWAGRSIRDGIVWLNDKRLGYPRYDEIRKKTILERRSEIRIRFLGLWDTVAAYGMPVEELKTGIDKLIWPMEFRDFKLYPRVDLARHALSVDDERATFWPKVWDERLEDARLSPARIKQVYFPGVHADVGGGYAEDRLSYVPLVWMMDEAKAAGLDFRAGELDRYRQELSPFGKMHDSREGAASFFRYKPRRIDQDSDGLTVEPIVHHSVIERMGSGADAYAPVVLPANFRILRPDGVIEPAKGFGRAKAEPLEKATPAMAIYEAARRRIKLDGLDENAVALVRDVIWWRRVNYFATLTAVLACAAFPFIAKPFMNAVYSQWEKAGTADAVLGGPAQSLSNAIGSALPSYAAPWSKALTNFPVPFAVLIVVIVLLFIGGGILKVRIAGLSRMAWKPLLTGTYFDWISRNRKGWRNTFVTLSALCLALAAYNYMFAHDDKFYWGLFAASGAYFGVRAIMQAISVNRFEARRKLQEAGDKLPIPVSLKVARWIRTSSVLQTFADFFSLKFAPIALALSIVAGALLAANRAIFDIRSATGVYCKEDGDDHDAALWARNLNSIGSGVVSAGQLRLDRLCSRTGILLEAGKRYSVTIEMQSQWFDRSVLTDAGGFATHSPVHFGAALWRRWWFENWFQPILRIGLRGNDEYVIAPDEAARDLYFVGERGDSAGTGENCPKSAPKISNTSAKPGAEWLEELGRCYGQRPMIRKISAEIVARRSGEAFFYVNDAVLPLGFSPRAFYKNNSGTAKITIRPAGPQANGGTLLTVSR